MHAASKKICVVGLGYVGLPTASLLGTKGYSVVGVDTSADVVQKINAGQVHIVEPELNVLVKSAIGSGNLRAQSIPEAADVFIIAVPTPIVEGSTPDIHFVEQATKSIAPYVTSHNLVILELTCPVGTTQKVVAPILKEAGHDVGEDVHLAYCPERVLPGRILMELVNNDRIVGGITPASTEAASAFLREFVAGEVFETNCTTAEFVKLSENAYRDLNIAFANELSIIADQAGINPWEAIRLANRHPRVNILAPGPGVGGHCVAVDPWFLISHFPKESRLMRTAREVNEHKVEWVCAKVKEKADRFKNPTIACLGLTFKADVDDVRESPSLRIFEALREQNNGRVIAADPFVRNGLAELLLPAEMAIKEADIVVLLVDHRQFRKLKLEDFKDKILIDTRGAIT